MSRGVQTASLPQGWGEGVTRHPAKFYTVLEGILLLLLLLLLPLLLLLLWHQGRESMEGRLTGTPC